MALSKEERAALKDSDFAIPEHRLLPLVDKSHVLMAMNALPTMRLSEEDRYAANERILARAAELNVSSKTLPRVHISLEAMSLEVPIIKDHPNRHPFSGILTRLDIASDFPVGGTPGKSGKKVIIPTLVAEKALPTLLGMAIDFTENLDAHDRRAKIGIITEAYIGEEDKLLGTPLHIAGFFYAADFPDEVATIQANREDLGFSYEAEAYVERMNSDPWVVSQCSFTGAAVLFKAKAAFTSTSLQASQHEGVIMTPEELAALQAKAAKVDALEAENAELKSKQDAAALTAASLQNLVKPHAEALRTCAANMLAAGIGADASYGHAMLLNKMADGMEAAAVLGRIPSTFDSYFYAGRKEDDQAPDVQKLIAEAIKPFQDQVAAMQTKLDDSQKAMQTLSAGGAAPQAGPTRKSLSAGALHTLKRIGLNGEEQSFSVQTLDAACKSAGMRAPESMALKLALKEAGVLA